MTLDVGPGRNYQPHSDLPVIRLDHRVIVNPSVAGDVRVLPFRDESFDVLYASHVLEHFHERETLGILREWMRVLRVGGELQVFVPNLEWCLLQITHGIHDEFVMNALYGRQEYESDVHRTGFTPQTLQDKLLLLPLRIDSLKTFRNNICVWATKVSLSS